MTTPDKGTTDVFGLRPYGEALRILSQAAVDGAGAFLSRICLPAAEEYGLHLRDKVSGWRQRNSVEILRKAEKMIEPRDSAHELHAHPRIVSGILEKGSWAEEDSVQVLWAGLLASACNENGRDDSNLQFVDLLGRLSSSQVALIDKFATQSAVMISPAGWLVGGQSVIPLEGLIAITGLRDLHTLDRELDYMVTLGLFTLGSGLDVKSKVARITLTTTALQLYARASGHSGSPEEFYRDRLTPWDEELLGSLIIDGGDLD